MQNFDLNLCLSKGLCLLISFFVVGLSILACAQPFLITSIVKQSLTKHYILFARLTATGGDNFSLLSCTKKRFATRLRFALTRLALSMQSKGWEFDSIGRVVRLQREG